jgi:hypothetical protein
MSSTRRTISESRARVRFCLSRHLICNAHAWNNGVFGRWWKAKLRPEDEVEEKVGLVPASYVEEVRPIKLVFLAS